MPCGTKLSSNKNAKSGLTLTPDKLDYKYIYIYSFESQRGLLQTFSHVLLFIAQTFRLSGFFSVHILQKV